MFKRTKLCSGLMLAFGGTLSIGSLSTMAQQAPAAPASLTRVEITGTRIKSFDVLSNSPILSVSIEDIRSSQPVVIEEFFKGLPAAVPGIGAGTNNGSGGGATIDLRGLGANRSLVLIDGRRVVPFDLTGAVDTNVIPISLLQRVDLVTGGASAVYGADAVAGVANFVLRKDFSGFEVTSSYGSSGEGDAKRKRTDFTLGSSLDGGRGNVALSFGVTQTDPLRQDARELGKVARSSSTGKPQGSFTTVPVFVDLGDGFQVDPVTGGPSAGLETFNFNPFNYYQTPLDRTQFTALGNYVINDHAEVYSQLLFTRAMVGTQLAPSGSFFNDYAVPLGNPYITPALRQALCDGKKLTAAQCADNNTEVLLSLGRRFTELGPRLNDFQNTMYQWTGGLRGSITGNWTYDLYTSIGKSDQLQTRGNWGSFSKVQQALRAQSVTNCVDPANGCVPLNIFGADGSITPKMLKFINLDAVLTQQVEQKVVSGSVSGDLGALKSPMSRLPINVALGVERRTVTAGNKSDAPTQINGEVLGTGAPLPDRTGKLKLEEAFAEAVIPLITAQPFAEKLNLELGYRQSKFTTTSSQNYGTYKVGGEWEPVKGFRFRAMQQRATRAPNVDELYAPLVTGLDNLAVDPCQGTSINAAEANTAGTLSNLCRLTGVPIGQIGKLQAPSAGQVNILSGGNPALAPEEADTTTIGFVFQPAAVEGLAVTVDYWRIKIAGAVSNPAVDDVLGDCYTAGRNPALGFNAACAKVGRNPNTGSFNGSSSPGILLDTSNLGAIETAGWDLGVSYGFSLKNLGANPKWGRVDLSLNASILDKYLYQATPASVNRDCVGFYSVACGTVSAGAGPINKTKWSQRTTWTAGDWVTSLNWRHLSGVQHETGFSDPAKTKPFFAAYSSIESYDNFDLGVAWKFNKNLRVNLSVNNLFDKKPPEVGNTIGSTGANSGNTFPQTYDVIGRYFTLGASLTF